MKASVFFILLSAVASAQVIEVNAGSSTLGRSMTGVTVSSFLPNSTTTLSGGVQDGRIALGASHSFDIGKTEMTVGTQQLLQSVDGAGVSVTGVGVSATKTDQTHENAIGLFAGTVGVGVFMPYIRTATPQHLGGGLFVRHHWKRLHVGALALDEGSLRTGVGSLSWNSRRVTATAVGGVLNNRDYFSGNGSYRLSRSLTFFGGHTVTATPIHSTSDDAGASFNLGRFSVTAIKLRSSVAFKTVSGESVSLGTTVGPVRNYVAFTKSSSAKMLIETAYEQVTRHWLAQQIVIRSQGSTSIGFGGGYTSNRVSFGVDYGVGFIPQARHPFQRTVTVHVDFSIHGTRVTAQTLMTAGLKPLYQLSGERWMQGPIETQGVSHAIHTVSSGKYQVTGVVTDSEGNGIEGVAIVVGRDVLYSNTTGRFSVTRKSAKAQSVHIDLGESTLVGDWKVKDCPGTVTPAIETTAAIHIVLIRP